MADSWCYMQKFSSDESNSSHALQCFLIACDMTASSMWGWLMHLFNQLTFLLTQNTQIDYKQENCCAESHRTVLRHIALTFEQRYQTIGKCCRCCKVTSHAVRTLLQTGNIMFLAVYTSRFRLWLSYPCMFIYFR